MKTNITRIVRTGHMRLSERLHVKSFATLDAACVFLNRQPDNSWRLAAPVHADKKAGIYAYAGGQWHNVRSLDSTVLAHI